MNPERGSNRCSISSSDSGKFKINRSPHPFHSVIYEISYATHDHIYEELKTWKSRLQSSSAFYGIIHGNHNFSNLIKSINYIYLIDFEDSFYSFLCI